MSTTPKTWAQRGKEALAAVAPTIDTNVPEGVTLRGGEKKLEPIQYYNFTAPKPGNTRAKQIQVGDTFYGTYEGFVTFEAKRGPMYTYKIRTEKGLEGVPGCAQLNNELKDKQPLGSKLYLKYNGKVETKTGVNAGAPQHNFTIGDFIVDEQN
jgi:hypothetical protein